jgi:endonuclease/exonuclease/phosphatase family metal-dependent hydrolase
MAALFFRTARFEKLAGGHFWLSETPDRIGSKGWDAALPRVATWVKLRDRTDPVGLPVFFLNTHFDHRGTRARAAAAALIRRRLAELGAGCRLVVVGDFNADQGSEPYARLFGPAAGPPPLVDTLRALRPTREPHEGTFNGFRPAATDGERIDWIGASPDWEVRAAGIDRTVRAGRVPSDHFPVFATLRAVAPRRTLRALTYNIHHGVGVDGKLDVARIARAIRDADPDLVALQEVDRGMRRSGGVDQTAELAWRCGLHGRFGKALDSDGGADGQALLARMPLEEFAVHPLPNDADGEPRIALAATVSAGGVACRWIGTHLDHRLEERRVRQAAALRAWLEPETRPALLAGDFNAPHDSLTLRALSGAWTAAAPHGEPTFPAPRPTVRLDHLLLRPASAWRVVSVRTLPEAVASDHRPVLAELELP